MKLYLNTLRLFLLVLLALSVRNPLCAQTLSTKTKTIEKTQKTNFPVGSGAIVSAKSKKINIDMNLHAFSDVIPFDEPFLIVGAAGPNDDIKVADLLRVDCWWAEKKKVNMQTITTDESQLIGMRHSYWPQDGGKEFVIPVTDYLKPNRDYVFVFRYSHKITDPELKNWIIESAETILGRGVQFAGADGRFTFNDQQMQALITNVQTKLADALRKENIAVNFNPDSKISYKQFFDPARNISQAYSLVAKRQQQLDSNTIPFIKKGVALKLTNFFAAYKQTHNANDTNVVALKKAVDLLPQLYLYPKDAKAADADAVAKYFKIIESFNAGIAPLLVNDAAFTEIKNNLTDRTGELAYYYKEYADRYTEKLTAEADETKRFVEALAVSLFQTAYINGSTVDINFVTRANSYISADLGVAVIPDISVMAPYLGTNIYLRPINKSYPITWRNNIAEDFFRRFSFLIGLTVTTLQKTGYRGDLLASNFNLITGAGFRVSDGVRINGGTVWYSQINPNPLNTNKSIVCSAFASLSFDIDVKTVFNHLFTSTKIPTIKVE